MAGVLRRLASRGFVRSEREGRARRWYAVDDDDVVDQVED